MYNPPDEGMFTKRRANEKPQTDGAKTQARTVTREYKKFSEEWLGCVPHLKNNFAVVVPSQLPTNQRLLAKNLKKRLQKHNVC